MIRVKLSDGLGMWCIHSLYGRHCYIRHIHIYYMCSSSISCILIAEYFGCIDSSKSAAAAAA